MVRVISLRKKDIKINHQRKGKLLKNLMIIKKKEQEKIQKLTEKQKKKKL